MEFEDFHPSTSCHHTHWLLHIHLEDGRLLEWIITTFQVQQLWSLCQRTSARLLWHFYLLGSGQNWSPIPRARLPAGVSLVLLHLGFLGFEFSSSHSNTFASSFHVIFYLGPREMLRLTGHRGVFEVCWLWLETQLTGISEKPSFHLVSFSVYSRRRMSMIDHSKNVYGNLTDNYEDWDYNLPI